VSLRPPGRLPRLVLRARARVPGPPAADARRRARGDTAVDRRLAPLAPGSRSRGRRDRPLPRRRGPAARARSTPPIRGWVERGGGGKTQRGRGKRRAGSGGRALAFDMIRGGRGWRGDGG